MSGEKDLEQLKKEAAAKAKAAAMAKMKEKEQEKADEAGADDIAKQKADAAAKAKAAAAAKAAAMAKMKEKEQEKADEAGADDIAKQKADAAAKAKAAAAAKAAAMAKMKEKEQGEAGEAGADDIAKQKADAAAKAKAAAAAKAAAMAKMKEKEQGEAGEAGADDIAKQKADAAAKAGTEAAGDADTEKAKAIAAAKAKAAAAAKAKAAALGGKEGTTEAPEEQKPSPNQHLLDKYKKVIEDHLGAEVLEEAYINRLSKDVPTLVVKKEAYYKVAEFLKYNEQLGFDYLSELHGTDFQAHMEVYVHLYSYINHQSVAFKVKLDRDNPVIDSLVPLWAGADWPECEAYDLLGIVFTGHPNLRRIMLGEDWVGYPLRKDYVHDDEKEVWNR